MSESNGWYICYQTREQQTSIDTQAPDAWTWLPSPPPYPSLDQVAQAISQLNADERASVHLQEMPNAELQHISQSQLADLFNAKPGEQVEGKISWIHENSAAVELSWGRHGMIHDITTFQTPLSVDARFSFCVEASTEPNRPLQLGPWDAQRSQQLSQPTPSLPPEPAPDALETVNSFPKPGELHPAVITHIEGDTLTLTLQDGSTGQLLQLPTAFLSKDTHTTVRIETFDPNTHTATFHRETTLWALMHQRFPRGTKLQVLVQRHTPNGIWAQLDDNITFFLHKDDILSSMWEHDKETGPLAPGKSIEVWIERIRQHRVFATMHKQKIFPIQPGDVIEGTIKNVGQYGVFVNLNDPDNRGGRLPNNELSHRHKINHPFECFLFQVGHPLRVQVKGFSWDGQPELGFKSTRPDPWKSIDKRYSAGQNVELIFSSWLHPAEKAKGFQGFLEPDVPVFVTDYPLLQDPSDRELYAQLSFQPGQRLLGNIKEIDSQGQRIFMNLLDAQPDLLTNKRNALTERFKPGQLLEAQVASCDEHTAQLLFDGLPTPIPLPRQNASAFLPAGRLLNSLLTPSQSVIVEVLHADLQNNLELSLQLKGLGPS